MALLWLASAAAAVVAGLLVMWWRAHQQASRLRERLETASMELQHLQISFARFAPQEVVERIIASGVPTEPEKTR
jgi:hypothetical protein